MNMEKQYIYKTASFYMDEPEDVEQYDALRNNPSVHIISQKDYKIRESVREGDATTTNDRIYYLVHYTIESL